MIELLAAAADNDRIGPDVYDLVSIDIKYRN